MNWVGCIGCSVVCVPLVHVHSLVCAVGPYYYPNTIETGYIAAILSSSETE